MIAFWVLAPCIFTGRCQRFGEIYCLHLQVLNCNGGKYRVRGRVGWGSGHQKPNHHYHHQKKPAVGELNFGSPASRLVTIKIARQTNCKIYSTPVVSKLLSTS
jgi:hypothetical protein